jgi:predicted AAA+ superfamily ATPase
VGKTTLLEDLFKEQDTVYIDLLDPNVYDELLLDKSRFVPLIDSPQNTNKRVVIDEVQRLPYLLDIAHSQIQKRKRHQRQQSMSSPN